MPTDYLGNEVKIGDLVIFNPSSGFCLSHGEIKNIEEYKRSDNSIYHKYTILTRTKKITIKYSKSILKIPCYTSLDPSYDPESLS